MQEGTYSPFFPFFSMKHILFLAFGLVSCYAKTPENLKNNGKGPELTVNDTFPMYLTKNDSVFIHNIIYKIENTVEDSADYHLTGDLTIELNVRLNDGVVRTYILNRNGTIEDLADIKSDGSIIVYGEEGE